MSNPEHRAPEMIHEQCLCPHAHAELLPEIAKRWRFTDDPSGRDAGTAAAHAAFTSAGTSDAFGKSSASSALHVDRLRPAAAGKSHASGRGPVSDLDPQEPIRPLRIFLQDGSADRDNEHGNWFLAISRCSRAELGEPPCRRMADKGPASTRCAPSWGEGTHSDAHGGAMLPDVLRWIGAINGGAVELTARRAR